MPMIECCSNLTNDSVLGKGYLFTGEIGENRGIPDCSQMNGLIVPTENYTFLER